MHHRPLYRLAYDSLHMKLFDRSISGNHGPISLAVEIL